MRIGLGVRVWAVLLGSMLAGAAAAENMFAGTSAVVGGAPPGSILLIDDATGAGIVLGDAYGTNATSHNLSGLAFTSADDLYGSTRGDGTLGQLVKIDPDAPSIGTTVVIGAFDDGVDPFGVSDLATHPDTGVLYAVTTKDTTQCQTGACVYTIDTATAVGTLVGNTGEFNGGLSFAPDGTLWLATNGFVPVIAELDPSNASIIGSQPLVFAPGETLDGQDVSGQNAPVDGLEVRSDGTFFATGPAGSQAVVTIDPDTGLVSVLTEDNGAGKATDLAFRPDASAPDSDGDGVPDDQDICPGGDDNVDTDGDGVPDFCDVCPIDPDNDADGDGVCGDVDTCPGGDDNANADGDSLPDFCDVCPNDPENDADGDGVCESDDNCPLTANSDQQDADGDGIGDACDDDADNDTVPDSQDNCPLDFNPAQLDTDMDGAGDACDDDVDGDGVIDADDLCVPSPQGELVNADGCAISELCPCEHPAGGDKWKNHGAYVSCVAHAAGDFVDAGLITEAEKDAIVSDAGESECGHKNK